MKKLFSILLSVCMVLTMIPAAGGAVFADSEQPADYYLIFNDENGKLYWSKKYMATLDDAHLYTEQEDKWSARDDDGDGKYEVLTLNGFRFDCAGVKSGQKYDTIEAALKLPDKAVLEVQGENSISLKHDGYLSRALVRGKDITVKGGGTLDLKVETELGTYALECGTIALTENTTLKIDAKGSAAVGIRLSYNGKFTVDKGSRTEIKTNSTESRNKNYAVLSDEAPIMYPFSACIQADDSVVEGTNESFISRVTSELTPKDSSTPVIIRDRKDSEKTLQEFYAVNTTAANVNASVDCTYKAPITITAENKSLRIEQTKMNTISGDLSKIHEGELVTVALEPKAGYTLKNWIIRVGSEYETAQKFTVPVTDANRTAISFTMPAGKLRVTLDFEVGSGAEVAVRKYATGNDTNTYDIGTGKVGDTFTFPSALDAADMYVSTANELFKYWADYNGISFGESIELKTGEAADGRNLAIPDDGILSFYAKGVFENNSDARQLTVNAGDKGTYSIACSDKRAVRFKTADMYNIPKGVDVTLTYIPDTKIYKLDYWKVNGSRIDGNTFVMPDAADGTMVEAVYIIDEEYINVTAPDAVTGLVYNGEKQTGITGGNSYGYTVSGTDKETNAGDYTATVTLADGFKWADGSGEDSKTINWSIANAEQNAPDGLAASAPTKWGKSDGSITGVTDAMEYADKKDASEWTACTGTEITGLKAGTYYVRLKAKQNYNPSEAAEVKVPDGVNIVENITISGSNYKKAYYIGEKLDVTGLEIKATMTDESTQTVAVTADMVTGFDSSKAVDSQTLTITYEGRTATYEIAVRERPSASSSDDVKTTTDSTTSEKTTGTTVKDSKTETVKDEQGEDISKITAKVSDKVADKLVDEAVSSKSDNVEITVKSNDGNKAGQTEIEIPKKAVESIAKDTEADLVIKTDNGQIAIDNKALGAMAAAADGDTLRIIVTANAQLKEAQKPAADAIGNTGVIFEMSAYIGSTRIYDLKDGKAEIMLPVPENLKDKDIAVIYISDKGICEIVNHTAETVGEDNFVKFTVSQFADYAVVEKTNADKLIEKQNIDKIKSLVKEVKLKATTSKTSKENVRVKISGVKNLSSLIKEADTMGYTVKYKYYRSVKKSSKYAAKITKKSSVYINTKGRKGTKYYYKAKVLVYDGKTLIAQTELKQCRYGVRGWSK